MGKFYNLLEFTSILQVSSIKLYRMQNWFNLRNCIHKFYDLSILRYPGEKTETHTHKYTAEGRTASAELGF